MKRWIRIRKGGYAESNAELVEKMVRIARDLDRDIASPEEARRLLSVKEKKRVNF